MKYSIVVPLKNEENNVADLIREIEPVMQDLDQPWELICVNDGSTDTTLTRLIELLPVKSFLRVLSFEHNAGQSAAFDAGFKAAQGEFVITMDGDLQNDPKDIPKLLAHCYQADLVCGSRTTRKDSWSKRLISSFANAIRSRICHDGIQDTGCSLKIYRRKCLEEIKMYQGMHRFLPALFLIEGFRICEVPVNHRERLRGTTKYNFFNRSFNTIADLFAVWWMRKRRLNYKIQQKWPT